MAAVGPEGLPASVALADALIAGLAHRAAPDAVWRVWAPDPA